MELEEVRGLENTEAASQDEEHQSTSRSEAQQCLRHYLRAQAREGGCGLCVHMGAKAQEKQCRKGCEGDAEEVPQTQLY